MNRLVGALCVLLTVSAGFQIAAQQSTGSIRGRVADPSGAVVRGAVVKGIHTETGLVRTATTDSDGAYVLLELPVGHYQLIVEALGFQKYLQEGISLSVNETPMVPIHLVVGAESQQVQITADAPLIQSTITSLGKTVQEREILDLPLNGRNFSQLGLLQPGVMPITPGLLEAGGTLRKGQPYAVNGQRPESNNFLIDGANNFNGVDAGFVLEPPVDAITEFRILTHGAPAEFGHSTGSTTNIITRSGSNQFHGSAWEFLRNDAMDASDFIAREVTPLKQNQFGLTLGGPVRRDKTFFFGFYEGFRNREGRSNIIAVPSRLERTGDFSEMCPEGFSGGFCRNPANQLFNVFAMQPVPNNRLSSIHPISQALLQFFPEPNNGSNGFISTQVVREDEDQFGLRLDHYLSSRDNLNFRYTFSNTGRFEPISPVGANVPGFPVGEDRRAQNFFAQETHTFSPQMIGVIRFSFLRNKTLVGERFSHTPPRTFGFQYDPSLEEAIGVPFMQVNGYSSIGNPITGPRNTYQNSFDYSGSLTWVRGRHELKFGGGYNYQQINVTQGIATNGFFVFVPFPITNSFASFLFGQPVFFLQGRGDFGRNLRGQAINAYLQDTYKAGSRFTINLGLRYEVPFPYTERADKQNLFIPGRQSQVMPSAPTGLLYPGDPGVPAGLIRTQTTALAPRIGLAWDPTGSGRWLITSGYGIFYEPYYTGQGGPLQTPISAPPYLQTTQVNIPNFADPFNGKPPVSGEFSTPMTLLTLSPDLSLPYAQNWNLNIQRAFGDQLLFEIGFVGTKGTKLPRFIEGNPTIYFPGLSTEDNVNQRRLYSGCTLTQPDNCIFASTGLIAGISNSSYNALETSLRKQFSRGFAFLASYAFGKALDNVSSFNMTGSAARPVAGENDLAQNPFDLAAERGRSLFDARHRFVLSYQWSLPFWKQPRTWYQHVLGDWQLNGIATMMSGTPFTVFDSRDVSLQGGAPEITGFSANRPNLAPGQDPNDGPQTVDAWLNPNAFQRLTPDPNSPVQQFGTAGRNVAEGPGYANWDFSALKNIRVAESKTLQFRAEFFNFLNHANLRLPDSDISSPTFNQILAANPPRLIQFALKFLF